MWSISYGLAMPDMSSVGNAPPLTQTVGQTPCKWSFVMNGNKYSVSIKTRVGASPEEAAHHLAAGRRQAGNELYNILYSQKLPAVVDIEEISIPAPQGNFYSPYFPNENELRIEITVTPVQHRHVTIAHADLQSAQHRVQRTAGTWREFLNFVGRVAGSLRRR